MHDSSAGQLNVTCPTCRAPFTVAAAQAGSAATCPGCGGMCQIPFPASQVAGSPFQPAYSGPGQPGQYVPNPVQDFASKKIAAGICGILLGGLGVHKFILGFNGAGAIMLSVYLVCLVSGMCLVVPILGSMAMGIIGLVEGIIYLTKSDAEFYQLYAVQRKEWF